MDKFYFFRAEPATDGADDPSGPQTLPRYVSRGAVYLVRSCPAVNQTEAYFIHPESLLIYPTTYTTRVAQNIHKRMTIIHKFANKSHEIRLENMPRLFYYIPGITNVDQNFVLSCNPLSKKPYWPQPPAVARQVWKINIAMCIIVTSR